jgi:nucleotide-binding universal stress UspA family protein
MAVVLAWVVEGTWPACVDAAAAYAGAADEIVLLHVAPADVERAVHGAFAGLLGRRGADPGDEVARIAAGAEHALLTAAGERIAGRSARALARAGRVEREVVAAAAAADLLVVARDGDDTRLGPRSLGPVTRFVVDHAPCPVLLVWPGVAPGIDTIPPHPPHPPHRPPPRY